MFNHEPPQYDCPFCALVQGQGDEHSTPQDIVYQNEHTTAFIAPKWWVNNPGHVMVVPNKHVENIYDIADDQLAEVYKTIKKLAIAIRSTYGCDATSTRQHNEPAGNQAIWHFHVHVFPRFEDDQLYQHHGNKRFASAEERMPYVEKLRTYFATHEGNNA